MTRALRLAGALLLIALAGWLVETWVPGAPPTGRYALAALPILIVIGAMVGLRWGGQRAGPLGWLAGLAIAALAFGLTADVIWVSQVKGLLLALFVLAVLWPALLLYHTVDQVGGMRAIVQALEVLIPDRGLRLVVVAWAFSGMLEGLAGFGLPVAIVAPILVGLGVPPVTAVAAVAVGHAWSVTFGDMGVIFQTLLGLVHVGEAELASTAALMLGIACLACGLAAAHILGQAGRWRIVALLALVMGVTQYGLAVAGLTPLAALLAGLAGIVASAVLSQTPAFGRGHARSVQAPRVCQDGGGLASRRGVLQYAPGPPRVMTPALRATLFAYGSLTLLLAAIALIGPLADALRQVVWQMRFPQVSTRDGFVTSAGAGQVFRPLVHPGSAILVVALVSYRVFHRAGVCPPGNWRPVVTATWRAAMPASVGIVAMVGLSTLMDHTGMTQALAQALSDALDRAFPAVAPLVGMLGAFATGSNNNSNVLFAPLQERVAALLGLVPGLLLAAQTTGGALGSMIAPAKIMVGCSTVGLRGRDGEVLRVTLPYGVGIGLGIGALTLALV